MQIFGTVVKWGKEVKLIRLAELVVRCSLIVIITIISHQKLIKIIPIIMECFQCAFYLFSNSTKFNLCVSFATFFASLPFDTLNFTCI